MNRIAKFIVTGILALIITGCGTTTKESGLPVVQDSLRQSIEGTWIIEFEVTENKTDTIMPVGTKFSNPYRIEENDNSYEIIDLNISSQVNETLTIEVTGNTVSITQIEINKQGMGSINTYIEAEINNQNELVNGSFRIHGNIRSNILDNNGIAKFTRQ